MKSHPTVGVALFGSNVSERFSSTREKLPVISSMYIMFFSNITDLR